MAVLLLGITLVAFLLPQLTGVDPARAVIRARTAEATPDQATVDLLSSRLGLDRPLPLQYLAFLGDLVRGDLGLSFRSRTPVAPQLGRALGVSLVLAGAALSVALVVGLALGTAAAARGGRLDRVLALACWVTVAVPEFVLAPLLVLLLAVQLGLLPSGGWGSPAQAVLPVLTVASFPAALVAQLVRSELREVLASSWVRTSRAKGVGPGRILAQALRQASGSATAVVTLFLPGLLAGAVVVEVVFAVPGVGRLLYDAVLASDLPVTQAALVVVVLLAVLASLGGDLLRRALDPRVRT